MAKKAVLGRGLSALLPSEHYSDAEEAGDDARILEDVSQHANRDPRLAAGQVAEIPTRAVKPNPYQPRQDFDEDALRELADSITQLGIIQPLTVRLLTDDHFELISGERRLRAALLAGLDKVPAYIREADTEAMLEMAIVENIQREDLNPIEIAFGYQRLVEECGLTQEKVAEKVGKNRSTVTNTMRLLRLPPTVQAYLRDGRLSSGHARMLVTIEDRDLQLAIAEEIVQKELSVREVEQMMRDRQRKPAPEADAPAREEISRQDALQLSSFTDQLRTRLSTQVQIKHKTDGSGRIEIAYFSQDELERLLELLISDER